MEIFGDFYPQLKDSPLKSPSSILLALSRQRRSWEAREIQMVSEWRDCFYECNSGQSRLWLSTERPLRVNQRRSRREEQSGGRKTICFSFVISQWTFPWTREIVLLWRARTSCDINTWSTTDSSNESSHSNPTHSNISCCIQPLCLLERAVPINSCEGTNIIPGNFPLEPSS